MCEKMDEPNQEFRCSIKCLHEKCLIKLLPRHALCKSNHMSRNVCKKVKIFMYVTPEIVVNIT